MAKKKKFAGKETKLARLPLTQALTSQAEGGATLSPPRPSLSLLASEPLTWDEVSAGRGGPLAAAFFFLVRELSDLRLAVQSSPGPAEANHRIYLPDRVPQPPGIMQALRQARQSLQDLQTQLSHL
ncbi:MAG: hypothetical protein KKD99_12340 [Proteobacteria bacterium]|nr:hypothetical protein [Pseudomonadota bacterium]MBU4357369.1 hypothetical protein [Pseudomonadota bacterium]MBU4449366.1 hypothetical protein [Pseudomonadota bacterium]